MTDYTQAKYVQLLEENGQYTLSLLDESRQIIGHGYRGPTLRRAEQDLKYWTRDKGLEQVSAER